MAGTGGRRPGSGRKPGTRNKISQEMRTALEPLIKRGENLVSQIIDGKLPCGVCHGKGKTKYQPRKSKLGDPEEPATKKEKLHERTCQSCYGSGLERLSPAERLRAALEIMEYGRPKLRAIEHTGANGGPVEHKHEIVLMD